MKICLAVLTLSLGFMAPARAELGRMGEGYTPGIPSPVRNFCLQNMQSTAPQPIPGAEAIYKIESQAEEGDDRNLTVIVSVTKLISEMQMLPGATLAPTFAALAPVDFQRVCGDAYISAIQLGGSYALTAYIQSAEGQALPQISTAEFTDANKFAAALATLRMAMAQYRGMGGGTSEAPQLPGFVPSEDVLQSFQSYVTALDAHPEMATRLRMTLAPYERN